MANKMAQSPHRQPAHRSPATGNRILQSVPESEYKFISRHLEPFDFHSHAVLHEPNRDLEFAYFPDSGIVSLLVATEDGKTVEAAMVGNDGVVGVASAVGISTSPFREIVHIEGAGFRVKRSAFRGGFKSAPQFQLALSRYAVVQGMQMAQSAACNRLHDARQRLARWLLMTADRVQPNSLAVTHDFLSSILGTDRPSVSLAAQNLQVEKAIKYRRGVLAILDRAALESASCECYRVMRGLERYFENLYSSRQAKS